MDMAFTQASLHLSRCLQDLGGDPVAAATGRAGTVLAVTPHMLQPTGQVHAGVVATLADR